MPNTAPLRRRDGAAAAADSAWAAAVAPRCCCHHRRMHCPHPPRTKAPLLLLLRNTTFAEAEPNCNRCWSAGAPRQGLWVPLSKGLADDSLVVAAALRTGASSFAGTWEPQERLGRTAAVTYTSARSRWTVSPAAERNRMTAVAVEVLLRRRNMDFADAVVVVVSARTPAVLLLLLIIVGRGGIGKGSLRRLRRLLLILVDVILGRATAVCAVRLFEKSLSGVGCWLWPLIIVRGRRLGILGGSSSYGWCLALLLLL